MTRSIALALVALPFAFASAGCLVPADADEQIASASAASAIQSARNAGNANGVVQGVRSAQQSDACLSPAGVAAACAAEPTAGLYPDGCAVKTASGDDLHVDYHDCTGPFGAVHVSGGADASFTKGPSCDEVDASMHDTGDLTANGAPLRYEASASIRVDGGTADVGWDATWDADTSAGHATAEDHLQLAQDLGTFCVTASGTGRATLDGARVDSNVEGFAVCPDACPTAGTLVVTASDGVWHGQITITFDGSATAHAVGSHGQRFDVPLVCGS
ncbi:MAG TPA: hypothetical protein VHB21_09675 [Minicystis sp.]|nr:hypothetical protein [Minicystis sp.]